jgi:Uma2 family endonuclease
MLHPKKALYTSEEYFAMEESAEYKSEYYHGEIFAMAGCSPNHNQITVNLNTVFRNTQCRVFTSDMRVQIAKKKHYVYPDISVVCGEIEFAEDRTDMISNPLMIVEVLSESTKDYDRGSKFTAYRNIPKLQEYILIDQEEIHIEYFHKDEAGKWVLEEYKDIGDVLKIYALDFEISIQDIYDRVEW